MQVDHNPGMFFQEGISRQALGVNTIVLRQVAGKVEVGATQSPTGSHIMSRQLAGVFEGAREHLHVGLRGYQFRQHIFCWWWRGVGGAARADCDLFYQRRQVLDEHRRMLLHPSDHEGKKSVCEKQHVHGPKFGSFGPFLDGTIGNSLIDCFFGEPIAIMI